MAGWNLIGRCKTHSGRSVVDRKSCTTLPPVLISGSRLNGKEREPLERELSPYLLLHYKNFFCTF